MQRILVIRGGAIGDMVLTLPALGGLRLAFPAATIELLGHPARGVLAQHPRYVDQVTDLERWDMYRLFGPAPVVSETLAAYLHSWSLILSYLPVPDGIFVQNLRRYGAGEVHSWPPHPPASVHSTEHLLQPVTRWLPRAMPLCPRVYLDAGAQERAAQFWHRADLPEHGVVAFHPGSGGAYKLWPLAGWRQVLDWAAGQGLPALLIRGPAEQDRLPAPMAWGGHPAWPSVQAHSLLDLAAILARCAVVVGHDSGVTHLASAVGATVLACFGPTDPYIWGPRSTRACVLWPYPTAPLTLTALRPETVIDTLEALVQGRFCFTPSPVHCTVLRP